MADYIQVSFAIPDENIKEILIAKLAAEGYDGFEENTDTLHAFIDKTIYSEEVVAELAASYHCTFNKNIITETNWNSVWESNFQPVSIDDFVYLRADFHPARDGFTHEIVITPKMSFGTGHHATTKMMITQMKRIDFRNKRVFDFGTGTGVLAILAEKLGASYVLAIDNDPWSIENAKENLERNACERTIVEPGHTAQRDDRFDIVLANINKNILLENIGFFAASMKSPGVLLLSGVLEEDFIELETAAIAAGLQHMGNILDSNWGCMQFSC